MSKPPATSTPDESVTVIVDVEVEIPRFAFVKRLADGSVDFVSPLPTPFNYGAVPDSLAPDGDRLDVVLLGPRKPAGTRLRAAVHGVVHFVDAGEDDPKLVAGLAPPTASDLAQVRAFFAAYARAKMLLNRVRGRNGPTEVRDIQVPADRHQLLEWLGR